MSIRFTQYLMPDGRKCLQKIELPECQEKADAIIAAGLRFEMEMLTGYVTCSFTIAGPNYTLEEVEDTDLALELAPNGPEVMVAITKLINDFDLESYLIMKDEQTDAT